MDSNGLKVCVKNNKLVISLGIDCLADGFERCPDNEEYNNETGEYEKSVKITDKLQFAKDVVLAMENEREDGSNPLTDFLDKMCQAAVDDGSIAVKCKEST